MEFKLITNRYVANVITHWATFFGKGKQYNFFSYFIGFFSKGVRHYISKFLKLCLFFFQFWKMVLGLWYLLIGHVNYLTDPDEKYSIIMHLMQWQEELLVFNWFTFLSSMIYFFNAVYILWHFHLYLIMIFTYIMSLINKFY